MLATGGFGRRLAAERGLLLRANPWSEGDGLDYARARGAELAGDLGEFYGRVMPAPPARIEAPAAAPSLRAKGFRFVRASEAVD